MKFDFEIGEKVKVNAHGISGVINAIYIGRNGVQYEVEYSAAGEIKSRYFVGSELTRAS